VVQKWRQYALSSSLQLTPNWGEQPTRSRARLVLRGTRAAGGRGQQEPYKIGQGQIRSSAVGVKQLLAMVYRLLVSSAGKDMGVLLSGRLNVLCSTESQEPSAAWAVWTGAQSLDGGE